MNEPTWSEVVRKVAEIDYDLADEVSQHFLEAGYAMSKMLTKVLNEKENN